MPHVTPLVATHRATVNYRVDGLSHKTQMLGFATPGAGTSGYDWITFSTVAIDTDTAVQALAALLGAILPPSNAVITDWQLEHFVGGAYVPIYSNSIGINGSLSGSRSAYNRMTAVYRDAGNTLVRQVVMGVSAIAPDHNAINSAGTPFKNYFGDFNKQISGHIGDWVTGRSGDLIKSNLNYTISLDRKSRRRAGLI